MLDPGLERFRGVPLPVRELAGDPQWFPAAVRLGRIAGEFLVGQIGVVRDRAGWFHDADSAGTFTEGQLGPPGGRIQGGSQVDVGCCSIQLAEVGAMAGLDQVPRLQGARRA